MAVKVDACPVMGAAMDLVSAIEYEARVQAECMRHPNFREAYEAFRDKREPRFE